MKYMIAVPCMDMVHTLFFASVAGMHRPEGTEIAVCSSSLVYDARNKLAHKAVSEGFDRVLWLDSDMRFAPDLMDRLDADLEDGRDIVSAFYFTRKNPVHPCIFRKCSMVGNTPTVLPVEGWPRDSVFDVAAVGFGAVMMRVDLLRLVHATFGRPFSPMDGFGEDLSFCLRVRQLGKQIWCDPRIMVDHVGLTIINEQTYLQQKGGGRP